MTEQYQSQDNSSLHKYRTELPNIIFDLGLDPFALTLYLHYKKVAGDHGKCYQKKSTIAEATKMSSSTIKDRNKILTQPRNELDGKSLITITQREDEKGEPLPTLVEINDIWPENFKILSSRFSGDGGRSPKNGGGSPDVGKQEEPFNKNQKQQQQPPPPTLSAAAVSLSFYDCLKDVQIQDDEKTWISQNYSEEEVQTALMYMQSLSDAEIKTTWIQAFKWALKQKPKPKKKASDYEKANREYLEKIKKFDGVEKNGYRLDIGANDVTVVNVNHSNSYFTLSIESQTFQQELYECLKKHHWYK